MSKKSIEEIRKNVEEQYDIFAKIGWEFLNDHGIVVRRTYGILVDVLEFAENLEDLVDDVSAEIHALMNPVGYVHIDDATERKEVAEHLRKYIRWNVDIELWKENPEFARKKEN